VTYSKNSPQYYEGMKTMTIAAVVLAGVIAPVFAEKSSLSFYCEISKLTRSSVRPSGSVRRGVEGFLSHHPGANSGPRKTAVHSGAPVNSDAPADADPLGLRLAAADPCTVT